ncbi:MAG: TOBE domain-containing protein, partial [Candidatus Methanomethylicia archaeon]
GELKSLQRRLNITTIYVTHDQDEALILSDRVAVMNNGKILQVDSPMEIYNRPKNLYIASFIGKCTLLKGEVQSVENGYVAVKCGDMIVWGVPSQDDLSFKIGDMVACIFRPENFRMEASSLDNVFLGYVKQVSFLGSYNEVKIRVGDNDILVTLNTEVNLNVNSPIKVAISRDKVMIIPYTEFS